MQILGEIEERLKTGQTKEAWLLMTALRGPDFDSDSIKIMFSGPIRLIYGLGVINHEDFLEESIREEFPVAVVRDLQDWRKRDKIGLDHYLSHMKEAFKILGAGTEILEEIISLLWEEENDDKLESLISTFISELREWLEDIDEE